MALPAANIANDFEFGIVVSTGDTRNLCMSLSSHCFIKDPAGFRVLGKMAPYATGKHFRVSWQPSAQRIFNLPNNGPEGWKAQHADKRPHRLWMISSQ